MHYIYQVYTPTQPFQIQFAISPPFKVLRGSYLQLFSVIIQLSNETKSMKLSVWIGEISLIENHNVAKIFVWRA